MSNVKKAVSEFVAGFRRKPRRLTIEEYAAKMLARGLDEHGNARVSSVPQEPPIGYKKQPSMVDIVREAVRNEHFQRQMEEAGFETFDEANDFDVDEDGPQLRSPYELPEAASPGELRALDDLAKRDRARRREERFEYWKDRAEFQKLAGQEPAKKEDPDPRWRGAAPRSQGAPSASESPEARPEDAF